MSTTTKAELASAIAERTGISRATAGAVVEIFRAGSVDALRRGEKVEVCGFGSLRVRRRDPRPARNPRTGERVHVPERRTVHFKPSRTLRARLNGTDE